MRLDPGRRCRDCRRAGAALAALVLLAAAWAPAGGAPARPRPPKRPQAKVIRAEVRRILSDERFARHRSAWQRLLQWVREKLSEWDRLRLPAEGVGWWLLVIFMAWCVLALLAILAHMVWTVIMLLRDRGGRRRRGRAKAPHFERPEALSFDQLCQRTRRLAGEGDFRGAVAAMMLALLRLLEQRGALRYHTGKTNGDYVREYPPAGRGRDDFRRFALAFDRMIYAGGPCGPDAFRDLSALFEALRDHAAKKQ